MEAEKEYTLEQKIEDKINKRIAEELKLPERKVKQTAALLDEGNTVPFIARYRKEMTGGLTDEELRLLEEKLVQYRNLEQKRRDVMRLIDAQDSLSPELKDRIEQAVNVTELDDLYRPFRPKKRTRATAAREKGLEPLAGAILEGEHDPWERAEQYIDPEKEICDAGVAIQGASDIVAENISDNPSVRKALRRLYLEKSVVETIKKEGREGDTYDDYADFSEPLAKIKPHRILAINRGFREKVLDLKLGVIEEDAVKIIIEEFSGPQGNTACRDIFHAALLDGYRRLLHPSLERESWQVRLETAVSGAINVFKENLKKRLLVPPVRQRRVLGVDPGYRTGCKLACVSETGKLLEVATIYPTPPHNEGKKSAAIVLSLMKKHAIDCIAIGNGTASRESEEFISALIREHDLRVEYTIVNEAGASVYSASYLAQKEFPELDVAERSAVSIARRLQDPLAEMVKIEPRSIGVGQYQHDMPTKKLGEALSGTVEGCVNNVGVDLHTASASLLSYVAGINKTVALRIVDYRNDRGNIAARSELLSVPGLGPKVFKQCAGFLRLPDSDDYLERSAVHPESYELARRIMEELELQPGDLGCEGVVPHLAREEVAALARRLGAGEPTLRDILEEFRKPGRDPREDLPRPVFMKTVTRLEDLKPGLVLMGIVRNIVDFGVFVDIGVHQDGLVHISEIADRYIKHPLEVLSIEEVITVKIISVDLERKRIALSIKQACQ